VDSVVGSRDGLRVRIERSLQIRRHCAGGLRIIRPRPTPVGLRGFDGAQTGRPHRPGLDQLLGLLPVDLGPDALGSARRELLQPPLIVQRFLLPVDPAVA